MRYLVVCLAALIITGTASARTIYVVNNSTEISDAQVADALPAFQAAVDLDFAPAWGAHADLVQIAEPPDKGWQIELVDQPNCWFCAGYHSILNGAPYAAVGAEGWQITFSHELFELLADPWINQGVLVSPRKGVKKWYALEVSDPVEASSLAYTRPSASGQPVSISDFVLPAWFRRGAHGPFSFTHSAKRPLEILTDGYQLVWTPTGWDNVKVTKKNYGLVR